MRRTGLLLCVAVVTASCRDALLPDPRVAAVQAARGAVQEAPVASTLPEPLVVRVTDARGKPVRGASVAWSVPTEEGELLDAMAETDGRGEASARWRLPTRAERYSLTATVAGKEVTFRATARPGPVARLAAADTVFEVVASDTARLRVEAVDEHGNPAPDGGVAWTSSDTTILAVDTTGRVRGVRRGEASVTARAGSSAVTWRATVLPRVGRIYLHSIPGTVMGAATRAEVVLREARTLVEIRGRRLTWTSSDTAIAVVDSAGTIRGVGVGSAQITVVVDGLRESAPVSVAAEVGVLDVVEDSLRLYPGMSTSVSVRLRGSSGESLSSELVRWTSSDLGVATASSIAWGWIHARAPGQAIIRVQAGSRSDSLRVRVMPLVFTSVSSGGWHTCGISTEDDTLCWAVNQYGEAGTGRVGHDPHAQDFYVKEPRVVVGGHRFVVVASGGDHTCALTAGGAAYCWGSSQNGQGAPGAPAVCGPKRQWFGCTGTPMPASPGPYRSLAAGERATCAMRRDGGVSCWGDVPSPSSSTPSFRIVVMGGRHACGLDVEGRAFCWGHNSHGQLGVPAFDSVTSTPRAVAGGHTFRSLAAGGHHTCGVTTGGEALCWGANAWWQLGTASMDSLAHPAPERVRTSLRFRSVTANWGGTCAITTDGAAHCWGVAPTGTEEGGETCFTSRRCSGTPFPVAGGFSWKELSLGAGQTCGTTPDGHTYCWGFMPGDGRSGEAKMPVRVSRP